MNKSVQYPIALAFASVLVGLLGVLCVYFYTESHETKVAKPKVVKHEGLARFPVLDSRDEIGPGIFIACTAYSNRPGFDVHATVTASALGFRVLSDCRTVKG